MSTNRYSRVVKRAALPEVLFASDIALALDLSEAAVVPALKSGRFGPHVLVSGRPAVLRQEFLQTLAALSRAGTDGKEVLR